MNVLAISSSPQLHSKKVFHNWNTDYYYENDHTVHNGKASVCIRYGK